MLSRVANSIYWMTRFLERAENIARFIDVNLNLTLELGPEEKNEWEPLVKVTGDSAFFRKKYATGSKKNVLKFLTFDTEYPNSIYSCVHVARENARSIREIISSEVFEHVNNFYLSMVNGSGPKHALAHPHEFYTEIKTANQLFTGLCEGTMSHTEGWHFINLGRMLERADKTSRILDVKYFILLPDAGFVGTPLDNIQWSAVLKSASGLEMYRKRFHHISPEHVAQFLIYERSFPRAIRFCLAQAEYSLHQITETPMGTYANLAEQGLGRLRSQLEFSSIQETMDQGLHEYLDHFQSQLNEVGNAIEKTFFELKVKPKETHEETDQ